jgi:hypothetical protein
LQQQFRSFLEERGINEDMGEYVRFLLYDKEQVGSPARQLRWGTRAGAAPRHQRHAADACPQRSLASQHAGADMRCRTLTWRTQVEYVRWLEGVKKFVSK